MINEQALDQAAKHFHLDEWQKEVLRDFATTALFDTDSSPRVHRPTMLDSNQLIKPTFVSGTNRIPLVKTLSDV